jgi:hypothetical protein
LGFGSTFDLQRPELTTTVHIGGGLSIPTSFERSKGAELHEGVGLTSLASDLSVSEGPEKRAVEGVHLMSSALAISGLGLALSGSPSSAPGSPSSASLLMHPAPAIFGPGLALSGSPSSASGCSDLESKWLSNEGGLPKLGGGVVDKSPLSSFLR